MGNLTFKGGIHPLPKLHHGKVQTEKCPIEIMPAPEKVSIPISQHIGAPANPIVKIGDHVALGQLIAEATGFVSAPIHASVSGTVTDIAPRINNMGREVLSIIIENDGKDELSSEVTPKGDFNSFSQEEIKQIIKNAGNVGLGGAGFPTHAKLYPPEGSQITDVIVNGAECEPFLTGDHRIMLEHPEKVVMGVKAIMKSLGVTRGFIAVEDNKPDAAEALRAAIDTDTVQVKLLQTKYPQGSEKQLIDTITRRQVPSGKLPSDVGVVVVNASSTKAIADAFITGMPIVERVVTVTGHFNTPKNLLARLGTPIMDLVNYCGGFKEGVKRVVAGGPMMGFALANLDIFVTKTTSGLLALGEDHIQNIRKSECIHCGRCASVCPVHLMPMYISAASEKYQWELADKYHAMDCMSCGSCAFICPANRPLAHQIRIAKDEIGALRRKKQQQQTKQSK